MSITTPSTKTISINGLILQHFKTLLADNFAFANLKLLGLLLVFIHLGFFGIHRFLVGRFKDGLKMLLTFGLGIGIFYLPITGFWMIILKCVAVICQIAWILFFMKDFFAIIIGGFGHTQTESISNRFGIFVSFMLIILVVIYFEYIGLHFQEIPYLPEIVKPALKPLIAAISFITNLF